MTFLYKDNVKERESIYQRIPFLLDSMANRNIIFLFSGVGAVGGVEKAPLPQIAI